MHNYNLITGRGKATKSWDNNPVYYPVYYPLPGPIPPSPTQSMTAKELKVMLHTNLLKTNWKNKSDTFNICIKI